MGNTSSNPCSLKRRENDAVLFNKQPEQEKRNKDEEDRKQKEIEEERKKREEEDRLRKQREEEDRKRREEEERKKREEERKKREEEERRRREEEERKRREEEERRRREDEERKKRDEEERKRREEEERLRKQQEEERKRAEERTKRAANEAALRKKITESLDQKFIGNPFTPEGSTPPSRDETIEKWFQGLINPNEWLQQCVENWIKDSKAKTEEAGMEWKEETNFKFRIEFTLNGAPNLARKLITRYLCSTPYNAYHAGLRIGGTVFDWRSNSLTYPRNANHDFILLFLDVGVLNVTKVDGVYKSPELDALCKGIQTWNLEKTYDSTSCNCAHFVDDLFRRIQEAKGAQQTNIIDLFHSTPKDRSLEVYFKLVKQKSECRRIITKEMIPRIQLSESELEFKTHEQLDKWWIEHNLNEQEYPNLAKLLKAYDRAFRRDLSKLVIKQSDLGKELEKTNNQKRQEEIEKELAKVEKYIERCYPAKDENKELCAFPPDLYTSPFSTLPSSLRTATSGSQISGATQVSDASSKVENGSFI